jgi:hypothetical protein
MAMSCMFDEDNRHFTFNREQLHERCQKTRFTPNPCRFFSETWFPHVSDTSTRGMEKPDECVALYCFSCVLILEDYLSIYSYFDSKYLHAKILETDSLTICEI